MSSAAGSARFAARHGVDLGKICRDAAMTWDELRQIAADPLCTIGAHTVHHLQHQGAGRGRGTGRNGAVGRPDRGGNWADGREHFAYPYGDETSAGPRDFALARKAGFRTAVTTRKGMMFPAHADHLTALPRFSLSGDYQNIRYVSTLLSGVPFALFNGLRTVNVN